MTRFSIVPERSRVSIDARSSLHPIHTETDGLEGWVELDVADGAKVNLAAPPAGHLELPVEQLRSGNALEDRELQRRIDARRYPTIAGDLSLMKDTAHDGRYLVAGDLTFRGVTRRCQDEMIVERLDPRTIRLSGESTFDVRDFGMEPPRILMFKVQPDVKVAVEIIAEKEED
jgi:polyisoprenoid-binding protein YceI